MIRVRKHLVGRLSAGRPNNNYSAVVVVASTPTARVQNESQWRGVRAGPLCPRRARINSTLKGSNSKLWTCLEHWSTFSL